MSKNVAFCSLTVIVYLVSFLQAVSSADCTQGDLFERWGPDRAVPVAALDAGRWYRAALGWIVAPDDCSARRAAEEMEAAKRAFERYFGVTAPRGAIVDVAHAGHVAAVKAAGAAWVLPWRFIETSAASDARSEAIRAQIRAQLAAGGREPDPARVEALVERALDQSGGPQAPEEPALEPKAIRHEIAHLLFMHSVWPSSGERAEQYGGDAPDWLDEAAAVVAESAEMTAGRRGAFRRMARAGRMIPLEEYLRMPHPVFAGDDFRTLMREARQRADSDGAAVVSASLPEERIERARAFYAQTRGLVDYLVQRTDDERVLAGIARSLRLGESFEDWLAGEGRRAGLPADIEILQRDFLDWSIEVD